MTFKVTIDKCPYALTISACASIMAVFASLASVSSARPLAPAVYVFGDSLADVGNNNYLPVTVSKADYPRNGVDFPNRKPTGRFSNGKNSVDFIAEKLGLASPPPYLYMLEAKTTNFDAGVNFASGGAGIFDGTDQLLEQSLTFTTQIKYYSRVRDQIKLQMRETDLKSLQSKAIHVIIIGSNDVIDYHKIYSTIGKGMNPTQFVASMVTTIKAQLQRIYDLGGRKFMILGLPMIGCCPQQRIKSVAGVCNAPVNAMAANYNKGLRTVLDELETQLQGFHFTYFDTFKVVQNFTQNPQLFGFKEVKSACCGLGKLRADIPCTPVSEYCPNRTDHLFWDPWHPTEAADRFAMDAAFDDEVSYTYPINLRRLVAI